MGAKICKAVGNLVLALSPVRWETIKAIFAQSVQKAEAYRPKSALGQKWSSIPFAPQKLPSQESCGPCTGAPTWGKEARAKPGSVSLMGLAVTTAEVSFRRLLKTSLNWREQSSMTPGTQPILSGQHRDTWVSLAAMQVITAVPEGSAVQKIDGWVLYGQLDTEYARLKCMAVVSSWLEEIFNRVLRSARG